MKIMDKEQERIQEEQQPEAKKKKIINGIKTALVGVVLLAGMYLLNCHPFFIGTPTEVTLGDLTIIPGETTVGELIDAGYEFSDFEHAEWVQDRENAGYVYTEVIDTTAEVEARTYYDLVLLKEGEDCAEISIVNENSAAKVLPECKVRSITVDGFRESAADTTIKGIAFGQISETALEEAMGKAPEKVSEDYYVWEKGNYKLQLRLTEEGAVDSVTSFYERK